MHGAGDNLFARSALAANQDRRVGAGDLLDQAKHGLHPLAVHHRTAHDVGLVLGLRGLEMVLRVPQVRFQVLLVVAWRGAMRIEADRGSTSQCMHFRGHRHTSNIRSINCVFNQLSLMKVLRVPR